MLSVSERYLHSPCEIHAMDNTPLLIGYISGFPDGSIEITSENDCLPIIHCNTTVKVSIMNDALGFRVLVGHVYLSTGEMIRIVDLQDAANYEKRNFFRVKVGLEAKAYLIAETENFSAANLEPQGKPFEIHIHNISLGGLYFICGCKLKAGDHLVVKVNIYHTILSLITKVIREIPINSRSKSSYGCEFLDNSGRQFDLLCKYLFACQREQIHRIRQNLPKP